MQKALLAAVSAVILSGCGVLSQRGADLQQITPLAVRVTVWARSAPEKPVVMERDAQSHTRLDATGASEEVISLLKIDTGEYIATKKELWVRATSAMLRAGADVTMWAPVPPTDGVLSRIADRALDPFSTLFGTEGRFVALLNVKDPKWSKNKLTVDADGGPITAFAKDGSVVRIEDDALVATIEPLKAAITIPTQQGDGAVLGGLFTKASDERNGSIVAGIAVNLHKAVIGFQAQQMSQAGTAPDIASISSRVSEALTAAVVPPEGTTANPEQTVWVSDGRRAVVLWDGTKVVAAPKNPLWVEVRNRVGSACVRLGFERGALGVSESGEYAPGALVSAAELAEDPEAWALVAVAKFGESACGKLSVTGTGW